MIELTADVGYRTVRVRALSRLAGVSTRTFYEHFTNVEDCLASTHDSITSRALRSTAAASRIAGGGDDGVRAAIRSIADEIAARPKAAGLALIETFDAGHAMRERMNRAVADFEVILAPGSMGREVTDLSDRLLLTGIVGGALKVIRSTLIAQRAEELSDVAQELGDWILTLRNGPAPMLRFRPRARQQRRPRSARTPISADWGPIGADKGRILSAAARLAASGGYQSLTVPTIRAEASVSRRAFDATFANVADCFLDAIELLARSAGERAVRSAGGADTWKRQVAEVAAATGAELARNDTLAHLVLFEIFAAGKAGLLRQDHIASLAASQLPQLSLREREQPSLASEASVGAAWQIASEYFEHACSIDLQDLTNLLTYMMTAAAPDHPVDRVPKTRLTPYL